jgi:hypothetical protein
MNQLYRKYVGLLQSAVPATTGPHQALSGLPCSGEADVSPFSELSALDE